MPQHLDNDNFGIYTISYMCKGDDEDSTSSEKAPESRSRWKPVQVSFERNITSKPQPEMHSGTGAAGMIQSAAEPGEQSRN